mgnify:CR=1 FL=1
MKKSDILKIIFIFIIVFSIIIVKPINNLDEIWNYNTARAISEGLIPYKDISMITTLLLPMITAIFLKIFANEVIISRILTAILWTGILFTIYKTFEKLLKEENISLIFTALIGILCRDIYCIDYNVTVLFLALIILNQELKNIKNVTQYNKKQDFVIGLLAGLAICTKQSIGVTLTIIVVGYKILFIENKAQIKQYLKMAFTRILGIILPVGILFIYLILNNALKDFINYAVLGISTFSNKIKYITLLSNGKIEIRILSILMPLSIIIMALTLIISKIKNKENENILNILTILVYSLSIIIVMYPISDEIHFLIGGLIAIIGLIYITFLLLKNKSFKNEKLKTYKILTSIICVILFAVILKAGVTNIYNYAKIEKNKDIKHYYNIEISKGLSEKISNVDNYILEKEKQGKKVYILDAEAAIYMIPINKYNKDYDMFLKGNIGKDGEQGQIEKIKQKNANEMFLIRKANLRTNWQTPLDVVNYVRENLEKVEEISIFEVYE